MSEDKDENKWDFRAGNLALDFANTVDWPASDHPEELLNTYGDLVDWAIYYALLTPDESRSLTADAEKRPGEAAKILEHAIALRDSIYRIFSATAHGKQAEAEDLERLKEAWERAVASAEIAPRDEGFTWKWINQPVDLEQILWPVSRAAVDLLLSDSIRQVGQCADDRGCGLLFMDTSRNHSRQWCSMDDCGNRAKARRHYRRSKEKG
jgi:predicted RNA-binding Zn ribbon-like protein